jgi:1-acyl-sn-glycerol-3-phosphate acyltransferase
MRAGVPVIPIAVVGSEEAMPIVFRLPTLAKALGVPYFPVTANLLALGPLGAVMPFPAKFKLRVLDPVHFNVPPDQDRYSKSRIMEESERIRTQLQEAVYDMLRDRRSVWFG